MPNPHFSQKSTPSTHSPRERVTKVTPPAHPTPPKKWGLWNAWRGQEAALGEPNWGERGEVWDHHRKSLLLPLLILSSPPPPRQFYCPLFFSPTPPPNCAVFLLSRSWVGRGKAWCCQLTPPPPLLLSLSFSALPPWWLLLLLLHSWLLSRLPSLLMLCIQLRVQHLGLSLSEDRCILFKHTHVRTKKGSIWPFQHVISCHLTFM